MHVPGAAAEDSHYRRSWFADAMFYLLARRNYKQTCKLLWPELTRFIHARIRLAHDWQFGLIDCYDAISENEIWDRGMKSNLKVYGTRAFEN